MNRTLVRLFNVLHLVLFHCVSRYIRLTNIASLF